MRIARHGGVDGGLNGDMIAATIVVYDQCREEPPVFEHFRRQAKMGFVMRESPRWPSCGEEDRDEAARKDAKTRHSDVHQINLCQWADIKK